MSIVEQLARYLARRLRLPFEGDGAQGAVFFGAMPAAPAKAVCVIAGDLRNGDDAEGTRVQVAVRSDSDGAWPLETAGAIMRRLDGARDALLTPGGGTAHRIEARRGFEFAGAQDDGTQYYTAEFAVYWHGEEGA